MAAKTNPVLCVECEKQRSIVTCNGCLKNLCYNDFQGHRQELNKQLHELQGFYDTIRQTIKEQISEPRKHPLIQEIDQWEIDSIDKIKQKAEDMRELILKYKNDVNIKTDEKLNKLTYWLQESREKDDFIETNLYIWKQQLDQFTEQLQNPSNVKIQQDSTPLINNFHVDIDTQLYIPNISVNAKWIQHGITVAGGNGGGSGLNQLYYPYGMYIDNHQTVYVADYSNHRIVEWRNGATSGQVVAGGNGAGHQNNQLNGPTNVIVDKECDCLIICDSGNSRVVRWPRRNGTSGETIILDVGCWGLTMDNDRNLYVCDINKHEVKRWNMENANGIVVAGGNGVGNRLDQLYNPRSIFVDQDYSIYVSDYNNHRVIKWLKDAREGVVVAGGHGQGNDLTQLSYPFGVIVDQSNTVYVADWNNHRVMRWLKGATQGSVVVGGNRDGGQENQLSSPCDLSFDKENNLYVVGYYNSRVQKFSINLNSS